MLDFLKFWKPKKIPVTEPTITITYDKNNQLVKIATDWPNDYPEHILKKEFAIMLLELQTGVYNKTVCESLVNKANNTGNPNLSTDILVSMSNYSQSVMSNNEDMPSMWPSQVFNRGS